MTKDSKSGLLLGLGFIICFMVILSNRGRWERVGAESAVQQMLALRTERAASLAARGSGAGLGESMGTTSGEARRDEPIRDGAATRGLIGDNDTIGLIARGGWPQESAPAGSDEATPGAANATLVSHADAWRARLEEVTVPAAHPVLGEETQRTAGVSPRSGDEATQRSAEGTPPPRGDEKTYVAAAGDSLSKIVKRLYGTATPDRVNAMFEANRDRMSSKDDVKAGVTLRVPSVAQETSAAQRQADDDVDRSRTNGPESNPRRVEGTSAASAGGPRGLRWYQVQKGDGYHKIAREQLGDERRWKEIAELNREVFPDPAKIRQGVRIRLPEEGKRQ